MFKKISLVCFLILVFLTIGGVDAFADSIYGVPWEVECLGNTQVGHYETDVVSFRFRSQKTGNINSLRFYFIDDIKSECRKYGDGDSGIFKITLQTDNNGIPSGTEAVAASEAYYDPVDRCADGDKACRDARSFPVVNFAKNIPLNSGTVYHIVFENVGDCDRDTFYTCEDGVPTNNAYSACTNWSSIENLQLLNAAKENHPARDYLDYTVLSGVSPNGGGITWTNTDRTPIFEVFHDTGGRNQGQGYIITYRLDDETYQDLFTLEGNKKVRQSFQPGSSFTIDTVRVRLKKGQQGSLPLKATISTEDGTVLGSDIRDLASYGDYKYLTFDFSGSPVMIVKNIKHYLTIELETPGAAGHYRIFAAGEGSPASYGFTGATLFDDGRAEQNRDDGAGWVVWTGYNQPKPYSDLLFYFETTPVIDSITVTSPNGGETLYGGDTHNITWNSSGSVGPVKIEYYKGSWKTVTGSTANDGLYSWTVPDVTTTSAKIRIKEAATGNYADSSNADFSIQKRGPAVLTSPTGPILPGTAVTFKWSGGAGFEYFYIKVGSSKGGRDYHNGWSSYKFKETVSGLPTGTSTVWVRIGSVFRQPDGSLDYTYYNDYSFSAFHRVKAELTSPSGTSVSGSTYTFKWNKGFGFDYFYIKVGSTKGGTNYHNGWSGNKSSEQVTALPGGGAPIWVRLGSVYRKANGSLDYSNYTDYPLTSN